MKRNALIRIVLWSILLVVLVSILSISLLPKTPRAEATVAAVTEPKPIPVETTVPSAPADPDALSGPNYPAQKIRELEIDWVIGNIMIIPTETDQILIYETNVTDPKDAMVVELEEGSLSIEYCKNWKKIPSFGTDVPQKDLTIYVPYDWNCSNIEINAASANLNVTGLTAG
ncbi:MAG: hypothetical protein J6V25_08770, partial [Oscillospiraceae bacterium]|nr:hypothetical protein [Oscillospiraceae bacterium]